jgi:hypothetical protein
MRPLTADVEPPIGAQVVTQRSGYRHHGIYAGDGLVVHYAGRSRSLHRGPVQQVSLGEDQYRLTTNNCEHFCVWCMSGESRSEQIERWLGLAAAGPGRRPQQLARPFQYPRRRGPQHKRLLASEQREGCQVGPDRRSNPPSSESERSVVPHPEPNGGSLRCITLALSRSPGRPGARSSDLAASRRKLARSAVRCLRAIKAIRHAGVRV